MKYLNKIASVFCASAMGIAMLTSCEGSESYSVGSPDWLQAKIDSIAESQKGGDEEITGLKEDVYTIGATDYSQGWWSAWSKYYQIDKGEKWYAQFNLNINPAATNTYKNFALIITNDENRDAGAGIYKEYGAIRFDNQPSGNSEWGDYIDRSCIQSNLTFNTDTDEGIEKLGGLVTLSIDRSDPEKFIVKMTNGTVTKTYTQNSPLPNLNLDPANNKIRAFLVPEGSYIGFLKTTIEPIGGCTSAADKQPLDMVLKNVPKKVLNTTPFNDIVGNITATISFETGVSKDAANTELTFVPVGDFTQLGMQKLCIIFNKTYKGENCANPLVKFVDIQVVDKMSNSIGDTNNTTGFLGVETDKVKINPNETYVVQFTNYSSCANNWNNFVVDFVNGADGRYGMARADLWCMDSNFGEWMGVNKSGFPANWDTWRADMDGAKVTLYITNVGDGTAELKADMVAANGNKYTFEYTNLNGLDPNDLYYRLTVDACHLEFDKTVGNESNTSGFLSEFTDLINVPSGKTVTTQFVNYSSCANNWNNFVVDFVDASLNRVGVARADLWCMDANFAEWMGVNKSGFPANWDTWRADMDGAKVNLSVTNVGDGTANLKIDMLAVNGNKYCFEYTNLNGINANDCNFRLSIDNSRIVQDVPFTVASAASAKKSRVRRR